MLEQTTADGEKEELEFSTLQQIMDYYYLKYHHDHGFVIGDNKLKRNVEVMIDYIKFQYNILPDREDEHAGAFTEIKYANPPLVENMTVNTLNKDVVIH